ncbi:MAG: hypothetical protein OEX97_05920 [Acidimicrobiia bacterium]|nr:hypothetical protein [Acidimicrobiia bacterium]
MDSSGIDRVLADLGAVMDRIAALPEDDFAGRIQLGQEQKRLRRQAALWREGVAVDRQMLEAELERLTARWQELQDQRIDIVMQSGGGSQGGDAFSGAHAMELNRKMDVAHGRDQIEARIAEIRRLLAVQD